jgi:hypothetical protein
MGNAATVLLKSSVTPSLSIDDFNDENQASLYHPSF